MESQATYKRRNGNDYLAKTPERRHAWRQDESEYTCVKCGIRKKTIWMGAMKNGKAVIYFLADGSRTSYRPDCT